MLATILQHAWLAWVYDVIFIAYVITIITIIIVLISENRNPVKSLAWVMVLMLLPGLGILLYLFFGRNLKNQHKLSRRNRRRLKKREPDPKVNYKDLNLSLDSVQEIRLGNSVTGSHFYPGNRVEVYTDGATKFRHLKNDLRNARSYINIQYYIFSDDDIGTEIADILIERALAGVSVRIIYDHVGSWSTANRFFKRMRAAGIEAYPYFKVTFAWLGSKINWRNHRKICIIDGRIGYIGGMNIADRYIDGGKQFGIWRDTHTRVEGPIVAALQYSFSVDWYSMGKPLLEETIDTRRFKDDIGAQLITSGPSSQWPGIAFSFLKAINNAKRRVYIQTPYFLPTDVLLRSLIAAALSRVDVRIMLPRQCDSHLLNFASASYISQCLKAGIKIYYYEPGMLHSKMIIIDDDTATIGSTNFDFRSFEHNFEANLFFYSHDLVDRLTKIWRDDQENSTRIMPAQWKHRPLWRKVIESIVHLLSPIL